MDVVGRGTLDILTTTSAIRWFAPELSNGEEAELTKHTDVFAFGMSILELLTLKSPYSHRKRDVIVMQDLQEGRLPLRPEEPEAIPWMTDGLWATLHGRCWAIQSENRLTIAELSLYLEEVSASLSK